MQEKYSVLMSVYYKENPEWLEMSIESILAQTAPPDEFVIVKDGPLSEELNRIIERFSTLYPALFKIVPLEKNVGLGPALNSGLENCSNDIIIRMDSDDYSIPTRCQKLLDALNEHCECGIIGSYETEFEDSIHNVIAIHKVPEHSDAIYTFIKRRCALLHPTILYRKSVIQKCGGYHNVPPYEDYDLFMRAVLQHHVKCYNIPQSLYYIRINDSFFKRRGGVHYLKTAVSFKWQQYQKGYMGLLDFVISAGGQAVVCLMPNSWRRRFYLKFLR